MKRKKIYAIVTKGGVEYAAHETVRAISSGFDGYKVVTKSEYQIARSSGFPSWGATQTAIKIQKHKYHY